MSNILIYGIKLLNDIHWSVLAFALGYCDCPSTALKSLLSRRLFSWIFLTSDFSHGYFFSVYPFVFKVANHSFWRTSPTFLICKHLAFFSQVWNLHSPLGSAFDLKCWSAYEEQEKLHKTIISVFILLFQ